MPQTSNSTNKALLVLVVTAGLFAAGHAMRHTASCFLLSFVIAYLIDPLVVLLEGRKLSRTRGIVAVYLILGVFSLFFFWYFVPFVILRSQELIPNLPLYLQKAKALGAELQGRFQPGYGAEEWNWAVAKVLEGMDQLFSGLGTAAYAAAASVVFNLFNLILAPILVFFMLHYKAEIKETLAGWLPRSRRSALISIGREIDRSIGGYLKGQLIVSLIVALLSTVALVLLEVDYPIFNGLFAGFASILPFIGVILAMLPPLFFAYLKFHSGLALVKVAAAFAGIYFLEGYLVKPLVFRSSMNLNPLLTIIMVMALGELFGFWGILLAIPVAAAAKIVTVSINRGDFGEAPQP